MMTRKDFVAVAKQLRENNIPIEHIALFANIFKKIYPRFNYKKFVEASTGDEYESK